MLQRVYPASLSIVILDWGGASGGETPLPIPNREVKPSSADGTARETGWESRSPPLNIREAPAGEPAGAFVFRGMRPLDHSPRHARNR